MLVKKPLLLLLMMLSIAHFAGFLSSSSSTTSTSKIVAFAQAEDGEETTPSFGDDERDDEDDEDEDEDEDEDDEDPPSNDNPDEIDPYPEIEDDEDSKIWPPPMPEVRHLKQYKVRMLKEFLDLRGTTCEACAEKDDWIRRVVDTWEWPKKEVDVANTEDEEDVGNEERRPYSGDEMTPEEEVAEEAARMKRMMDELNGGKSKDYTGMDPNRVRLLKKLQSKGLSFMGGENMDIEQLEQLANAMDGINSKNGGDL